MNTRQQHSSALSTFVMAMTLLRREWRAGELRLLAFAMIIAVASTTSVGFFTDRISQALINQGSELLGGDLITLSTSPIKKEWIEEAKQQNLRSALATNFPSVVSSGEKLQLVDVKAVSTGYPLRGELKTGDDLFTEGVTTTSIPKAGEVWVDNRLISLLSLSIGDRLKLGASTFQLSRLLIQEPDRGTGMVSVAPRLMMNHADLEATALIQPASRVSYRLLIAGQRKEVDRYREWLKPELSRGQRIITSDEGQPQMRVALERAKRYLSLASLISVLLSGIAIAMVVRRYAEKRFNDCALLRCLGCQGSQITQLYLWQMRTLGLIAGCVGLIVGGFSQQGLVLLFSSWIPLELPLPTLTPAFVGLATGMIVLIGFGSPPLYRLQRVPPARVLRQDLGPPPISGIVVYTLILISLSLLITWYTEDLKLTLWVLGGILMTTVLLILMAQGLISLTRHLNTRVGISWRFGIANISRRAGMSTAQILALGIGMMVILLLTLVRTDLLSKWRDSLPASAPNQFLINIQPDQVDAVTAFLKQEGGVDALLMPMVRGRLTAINQQQVSRANYHNPNSRQRIGRELNLTWSQSLQPDNKVVAGKWWSDDQQDQPLLSIEEEFASNFGIKVGDQLEFQIADQKVSAPVANLRSVEWDSFQVNFFVLFSPGLLKDAPATYITSFYLPASRKPALNRLVAEFPSITVIDVEAMMSQVRQLIDRLSTAVEYVFLFTLIAGLLVLYAAIQASRDIRLYESAVLKTLGARRVTLFKAMAAEFLLLGSLAGLMAATSATLIAFVLSEQLFNLSFEINPWIWIVGTVCGALGTALAGLLGARSLLNQTPVVLLNS